MPIYQRNTWVCEVCGLVADTVNEVRPYDDPVVGPPPGMEWDYVPGKFGSRLACPACYKKSLAGEPETDLHCLRGEDPTL